MAGLLDFLGGMGSTPPAYMEGLLGQDQMDKLKGQATSTGLANMVLGYLAAPKNQNLGLGRILGGAVQAGMQGAQGVYSGALSDYETQQKLEAAQKVKQQQLDRETAISQLPPDQQALYRAYGEAAVPKLVEVAMPKPVARKVFTAPDGSLRFEDTGEIARTENVAKLEKPEYKVVGNNLVDMQGNVIYTAPTKTDLPTSAQEYEYAQKNPSYAAFLKERDKGKATTINMPSESERTAGFLTSRLQNALSQINQVITKNPKAAAPKIGSEAVQFLTGSDYLKNLINPESRQQIESAQLELLDSALTLGTGAAYTREQLQNYSKSYFPQLGDKPANIADKKVRLNALLKSANIKAGRAAPEDFGLPANVTVERIK